MKQTKVVCRCPKCGKRLFDVDIDKTAHAVVTIPCRKCKQLMTIEVAHSIATYYITSQQQEDAPVSTESSK